MSDMPTEHLVKYPLPAMKDQDEPRFAHINAIQILGVYWSKGRRSYPDVVVNRRLVKLWKKKHPRLSKFFTPYKLWAGGWDYTYWEKPKVTISYGETKHTYRMPNNDVAEQVWQDIKNTFWKETV